MIKFVQKEDASVVPFEKRKIFKTVRKALVAADQDFSKAESIAESVARDLEAIFIKNNDLTDKSGTDKSVTVRNIRDSVEHEFLLTGLKGAAKAYKHYKRQHNRRASAKSAIKQSTHLVEDYLGKADWKIKENSNMGYSLQGLNNYIISKVTASHWLNNIYDNDARVAHEQGALHIHDLGLLSAYCCGWDLQDLLVRGFGGVPGKIESGPPKHLGTALGQAVNFFYTMQGESAGAQAFSNFDTLLAPFVRYDKLEYKEVKQALQEFIFNLNIPTRVGFQTPFTNITMDLCPPKILMNSPVIIGGEPQKETYGEFQDEMNTLNRAFCDVMMEGDYKGRIFSFPIPTYNITKDFNWEDKNLDLLWEMTAKYGTPYFANYINSDMDPDDARSMCCRLRLDNRELRKRGGGLFASHPLTGSLGVVTINLPRAAYIANGDSKKYFEELERLLNIARKSLAVKRVVIEDLTDQGLYPYSKRYLSKIKKAQGVYWGNHFNTIGILGMNEACLNLINTSIDTENGYKLAIDTLKFIREKLVVFQTGDGCLYNLEATPGEGTTYRFAKLDQESFTDIKSKGDHEPYYTNSTHLPVDFSSDIFDALKHQDEMQTLYTGGTVLHGFLGERIDDFNLAKKLVKKISENFKLPYFTITPTFSICPMHGYINGEHRNCPHVSNIDCDNLDCDNLDCDNLDCE